MGRTERSMWSMFPEESPRAAHGAVIVVGAGIAGLVAARLLHESGFDVIVVEARERIGGRLWTDARLGFPCDLGASWIHDAAANPLTHWRRRTGIDAVQGPVGSRRFYVEGRLERLRPLMRRAWRGVGAAATRAARVTLQSRRRDHLASLGDVMQPLIDSPRLPLFDRTLLAWITSASEFVEGAPAHLIDLRHWYPSESNGANDLPLGGYIQIADDAAHGLDIRLSSPVSRIEWGADVVRVHAGSELLEADAVILSVPLGVLTSDCITFDPPLPAPKVAAMARIGYGGDAVMNKVVLRFAKAFWPQTNERCIVLPARPQLRGRYTNWVNLTPMAGVPAIMGFFAGPDAARLDRNASDEEIVAEAVANLGRLSSVTPPRPEAWTVTRWLSDPWARGAYSYCSVRSNDDDRAVYARSVGDRLHFAGEGTQTHNYGTAQAALRSGEAAAAAIYRRFAAREPVLTNTPWSAS